MVWGPGGAKTLKIQWFGALEVPKPYKYGGLGEVPKPYKYNGLGPWRRKTLINTMVWGTETPNYYKYTGLGDWRRQNLTNTMIWGSKGAQGIQVTEMEKK